MLLNRLVFCVALELTAAAVAVAMRGAGAKVAAAVVASYVASEAGAVSAVG